MTLLAVVKNPASIARYLAAVGELTEVPGRSPPRIPPYWKSQVLRRQALGDENQRGNYGSNDERAACPRGTRRRNERKGKRGLHPGTAKPANREGSARRKHPRREPGPASEATAASQSRAGARRGRTDR